VLQQLFKKATAAHQSMLSYSIQRKPHTLRTFKDVPRFSVVGAKTDRIFRMCVGEVNFYLIVIENGGYFCLSGGYFI